MITQRMLMSSGVSAPLEADQLWVELSAPQATYKLGDTVTFTVRVRHSYGEPNTISLQAPEGLTLSNDAFADVPAGSWRTTTATVTITEADILAGYTATVYASVGNVEESAECDITDYIEFPNGSLLITIEEDETYTPADGSYGLGDTMHVTITLANDGNFTLTNVELEEQLGGELWTLSSIAPGQSRTYTASYRVTEADILVGEVVFDAVAWADSPDPDDPSLYITEQLAVETEDPVRALALAVAAPSFSGTLTEGDSIQYSVTATNTGNITLSDVVVTGHDGETTITVSSLEPGASATADGNTFPAYTVTAADEADMTATIVVTAEATSYGGNSHDVTATGTGYLHPEWLYPKAAASSLYIHDSVTGQYYVNTDPVNTEYQDNVKTDTGRSGYTSQNVPAFAIDFEVPDYVHGGSIIGSFSAIGASGTGLQAYSAGPVIEGFEGVVVPELGTLDWEFGPYVDGNTGRALRLTWHTPRVARDTSMSSAVVCDATDLPNSYGISYRYRVDNTGNTALLNVTVTSDDFNYEETYSDDVLAGDSWENSTGCVRYWPESDLTDAYQNGTMRDLVTTTFVVTAEDDNGNQLSQTHVVVPEQWLDSIGQ